MNRQKLDLETVGQSGPIMAQSGPKVTRVRISKPQHIAAIENVCKQLGSDRPIDAVEHILNCWLVGNIPPSTSTTPTTIAAAPVSDDEFAALMEF